MSSLPAGAGEPLIGEVEGRPALLVDGIVQSISVALGMPPPTGYWTALLPQSRPARALLLGFGGGTLAQLLLKRFSGSPRPDLVGVDDDPRVLTLARRWLGAACVQLVLADAADYLRQSRSRRERFDYIAVDLFRAGAIPESVCSGHFLGLVADVLQPQGLVAMNLDRGQRHPAQLRRLQRHFAIEQLTVSGFNLVAHARPRSRRRPRIAG